MSTHLALFSCTEPARSAGPDGIVSSCDVRRVLSVVRWPVGGIRTHLVSNYPVAAAAGWRFTVVGPADGSLDGLRDSMAASPEPNTSASPCDAGAVPCGRPCAVCSATAASTWSIRTA